MMKLVVNGKFVDWDALEKEERKNNEKELEALNYLLTWRLLEIKENNREKKFLQEEIILQALKRNEPVRLLVHDDNYGMVEAKSTEDYKYDEWWYAMGYCPIYGEQNPIGRTFAESAEI